PFSSTHFGWIDFGLAYMAETSYAIRDRIFDTNGGDKIKMLMLMPYSTDLLKDRKEYFKYIRGNIAATLFTCFASNLLIFCQAFDKLTEELLAEELAPSEESIFPLIAEQYPDLFDFYYGDYQAILANYRYHRITFTL